MPTRLKRILISAAILSLTAIVAVVIYLVVLQRSSNDPGAENDDTLVETVESPSTWNTEASTPEELSASRDNQGLSGIVEAVSTQEIVVRSITGETHRLPLTDDVSVYRGFIQAEEVQLGDIKVGASVTLSYIETSGKVTGIWVD